MNDNHQLDNPNLTLTTAPIGPDDVAVVMRADGSVDVAIHPDQAAELKIPEEHLRFMYALVLLGNQHDLMNAAQNEVVAKMREGMRPRLVN